MKGTVKFYNEMKGFGFIAGEDGKEYFVHQTGLEQGVSITENDEVNFTVTEGDRGPKAVSVTKGDAPAEDAGQEEEAPMEDEATEEEAPAEEEAAEEEAPAEEEATEEEAPAEEEPSDEEEKTE